jgi:hypothetical protein
LQRKGGKRFRGESAVCAAISLAHLFYTLQGGED